MSNRSIFKSCKTLKFAVTALLVRNAVRKSVLLWHLFSCVYCVHALQGLILRSFLCFAHNTISFLCWGLSTKLARPEELLEQTTSFRSCSLTATCAGMIPVFNGFSNPLTTQHLQCWTRRETNDKTGNVVQTMERHYHKSFIPLWEEGIFSPQGQTHWTLGMP